MIGKKIDKINLLRLLIYVSLVLTAFSYYYSDTTAIVRQSIDFWDALFSGRIFHYYSDCNMSLDKGYMICYANYDIVLVFLMSIWQLPLYIFEKILGGDIQRFVLSKMYSKLFLIIAIYICERLLKKISQEMGYAKEVIERIGIMFISSAFVIISTSITGQIDIIGMIFILATIYYLFKENNFMFVLMYMMAVQCKFFAFFIFVPLIVYKEKKIIKSAIIAGFPVILSLIISIPFRIVDPIGIKIKSERLGLMVETMFYAKIKLMGYTIPLLLLEFSALVLFAFFIKKNKTDIKTWYVYILLLSTTVFFLSIDSMPYWFIYYVPFVLLLFFQKTDRMGSRLLVQTICTLSAVVGLIFSRYWCFSATRISPLGQIIESDSIISMKELWEKYGHSSYYMAWTVVYAIFAAYMIGFLIYHFPGLKIKLFDDSEKDSYKFKTVFVLRIVLNLVVVNLCVWLYLLGGFMRS